jgi:hypothetical protein
MMCWFHYRLASLLMGVLALSVTLPSQSATRTNAPAEIFPGFSWERVPLNLHFGKRGEMTDAELDFIAAHSSFVVLEKMHGIDAHGSTEAGIAATARRLKQRNPRIKVFFYFNAFINWPGYEAFKTYREEWTLRDRAGQVVKHPLGTPRPDPANAAFRDWWSGVVADAVKRDQLDGVFADALQQARSPALGRSLGAAKHQAVMDGLRELLSLTKRKLGPGKLVLANGIRAGEYLDLLDWPGVDGVMVEHFNAFEMTAPAQLKADLDAMRLAAAKGKFVVLKGWPGFSWRDDEVKQLPPATLLQLARERITFPLACFLVGAGPGSHFCYSWGYHHEHGGLSAYPELDRPLGPPKGDAVWNGLTATREFAHASVWVDLVAKQARIKWRP